MMINKKKKLHVALFYAKRRANKQQYIRMAQEIRQICRKLRKGKNVSQIAEDLEEDEIRVQAICNEAVRFAPDYDEEQVVKVVLEQAEA